VRGTLYTFDGIVLGRREVGDSGLFLDILTDERGIIEAMAHGAKKLNSPLLSSSALFAYSTFCLSRSKARYTVNSAKPKYGFHELGTDIEKLALASYFAQAVRYCTPSEQRQDSIVRFFAIALYELLNGDNEKTRAAFELRYCRMLGFSPDLSACSNCGIYEHEKMIFLPDRGELLCGDCFDTEYTGRFVRLMPETLSAMRNIVFAELSRCFRFEAGGKALRQLSEVCEDYFLFRTERSFPALDYYKKLRL